MKYTEKEFFDVILRHLNEIREFEKGIRESAEQGEMLSEKTEIFAEFVKKFPDKDKEAAYALLFMMGVDLAKPKTVFEDIAAARSGEKPKDEDNKN